MEIHYAVIFHFCNLELSHFDDPKFSSVNHCLLVEYFDTYIKKKKKEKISWFVEEDIFPFYIEYQMRSSKIYSVRIL